jgi:hypothetical protein
MSILDSVKKVFKIFLMSMGASSYDKKPPAKPQPPASPK